MANGFPGRQAASPQQNPGLVYLGLEFQRLFASNTLRSVGRDAAHVVAALAKRGSARKPHAGVDSTVSSAASWRRTAGRAR